MTYLNGKQVDLLLKRIHPQRVVRRSQSGQTFSYVEAHDIKAELNRVFGFARWSSDVIEQTLVYEEPTKTSAGKPAWAVCYRSVVRLTVCAPDGTVLATYTEGHVGASVHPDRSEAHGNAVTNSESYALKRCAINLGDQFGLSLYNKGSQEALVRWTLVLPPGQHAQDVDTDDVPQVQPEGDTVDDTPRDTSPKPPPKQDNDKADLIAALVERAANLPEGKQAAVAEIGRLNLEAQRGGVLKATVEFEGTSWTVRALLDELLKRVSKAAA